MITGTPKSFLKFTLGETHSLCLFSYFSSSSPILTFDLSLNSSEASNGEFDVFELS